MLLRYASQFYRRRRRRHISFSNSPLLRRNKNSARIIFQVSMINLHLSVHLGQNRKLIFLPQGTLREIKMEYFLSGKFFCTKSIKSLIRKWAAKYFFRWKLIDCTSRRLQYYLTAVQVFNELSSISCTCSSERKRLTESEKRASTSCQHFERRGHTRWNSLFQINTFAFLSKCYALKCTQN